MAGATVKLTDKDRGWADLRRELETLAKGGDAAARAGIIGANAEKQHAEREPGERLSMVDLMIAHEFGAPSVGLPERSVLRAAFDKHRGEYMEQLRKYVAAIYARRLTLKRALGLMGAKMTGDQRRLISDGTGVPPPLSQATIERKGSTRPLIDTGQLWRALTWDVQQGGQSDTEKG